MSDLARIDSALRIALDSDSVRTKRKDGQLVVEVANITKANVCPYRGSEIPGWEELGLDPDQIYNLLRDPDELKKAAPTLNGVQLLSKHVPVNAQDHKPYDTVGSLGSTAEFDGTYIKNSLYVNAQDAIDGIESGKQRELSAGYHYKPDMTAGNFDGMRYDGVMRNIVFNHVALVEDGRAGPDVIVGDSMENLMKKSTRLGALTLMTVANSIAPVLAMDSKIELPKELFASLTSKNFKSKKDEIIKGIRLALDGKLRKGIALDASMKGLADAIDAFSDMAEGQMDESSSESQHNAMEAAAHGESNLGIPKDVGKEFSEADTGKTFDNEPIMSFLKGKGMADDDIKAVCDMLPKMGGALDEEDEEAKKKAEEEKKDKEKKDGQAMDERLKNMVSKDDLKLALDANTKAVEKKVRENEQAIGQAKHDVAPWVGVLAPSIAFDSAEGVHRHALKMIGVANHDKMHADALLTVLQNQPKPGAKEERAAPHIAFDSSGGGYKKALEIAPGLANIQSM